MQPITINLPTPPGQPPCSFNMIYIEGGTFDMGGDSWSDSSKPVHPVHLSDYWLAEVPVTQAVWEAVMGVGSNPSYFKGRNRPVERVSWEDIVHKFLPQLNAIPDLEKPPGMVFNLPTEAQWEYAARGGKNGWQQGFEYAGGEKIGEVGWCDRNSQQETKPVRFKLPNLLGLYDMTGNIWERCFDWYDDYYYEICCVHDIVYDPAGPNSGKYHVRRGGSWQGYLGNCCFAYRSFDSVFDNNNGFRLAFSPKRWI